MSLRKIKLIIIVIKENSNSIDLNNLRFISKINIISKDYCFIMENFLEPIKRNLKIII